MGQLRTVLRGYALEGTAPAQVLARLDGFLQVTGEVQFATCLYASYEPSTGRVQVASAGHLPPMLLPRDGAPRFVDLGPGVPLGGASRLLTPDRRLRPFPTTSFVLPPGAGLLLFSDGLVEDKGRPIDDGLDALRDGLTWRSGSSTAEEVCAAALQALGVDEDTRDDTTLLALIRTG